MTQALERQLAGLNTLIQLERLARQAESEEALGFVVVNETHALIPYRQGVLWRLNASGGGRIQALSGLSAPDRNAPYAEWLRRLLPQLPALTGDAPALPLTAPDLSPDVGGEWEQWLPAHAIWLPLRPREGAESPLGGLLLAREAPFSEAEQQLLIHLGGAYGHAWGMWREKSGWWRRWQESPPTRRRLRLAIPALLAALLLAPVRQSVLAPAEVTALEPTLVRAAIEGVVDRFAIRPNQPVAAGQLLLRLDDTSLTNRLEVARNNLTVAEAEYRQASQKALFDQASKARQVLLQGRMEQAAAEVAYMESLLQRIEIRAARPGIAVFEDVNDWLGRPVKVGEKILEIADPNRAELDIRLPVADAINLEPGAEVVLFLNVAPQDPLPATLHYASYKAAPTPEGTLAYRLKARFASGTTPPRVGLQGTAKIYGSRVVLIHYLLRRPLAALRQRVGL